MDLNNKIYRHVFSLISVLFLVIICFSSSNKAYADANLTITQLGAPYNVGNDTVQDISLSLKTKKNWKLSAAALNNYLLNNSYPSSRIPVSKMTIQNGNNSGTYQIEYNKPVIIASGSDNGNINTRCSIKINNSDVYYPGIYTGSLQFTLVSSGGIAVKNFVLSFMQNAIQAISITPNLLNINFDSKKSMLNDYSQESASPIRIYIKSNQKWKLILQGKDQNKTLNYAFKVLSGTNNSKIYYNSDYTLLPSGNFTISEGDPTVSPDGNSLDTAIIEVNYKLTTVNSQTFPAGSYPYNLIYSLIPS